MANRFPLVLNTSSNQIQELSASDSLDLSGSGLNLTGGTNINTGTRGDILVYNASGNIVKLNIGTSGQVIKSNGSDLVYASIGAATGVYYVTKSGSDSADGTSIDTAFATIRHAVANIGTPTATNPAIIFIKSGTYEEQLPIVVPAHTTIAGDSLRATVIKPAAGLDSGGSIQNNRSTMFKMSNATVLQDLVMDGMGGYTPGSPAHKPESATIGGVYLALNNASPVSTKSPYIYNCTSFGNGATGAVLDGSVHASGNRSMLFHTYTAVHSDGLGIFLKANANAEMISTFTYYCQVGFAAIGGSKIRSLNSSNAYGEYAVYSAGFDAGETANTGTVRGIMLSYQGLVSGSFNDGELITGAGGATAYVINVQAEPKRIYIIPASGTFQSGEVVTGAGGATVTLVAGTVTSNQSGRILVTQFASSADAGDSLQFASTDGNAYQIQSVSSVTANSIAYHVLVFSTSRATPVASGVAVNVRKEFSLVRLTGHDFLQVGTGGTDTTNWPNNPTQNPNQTYQVMTNATDPGRVYYTATDELGNFYVGDQFQVNQATGNVTLDASAFDLSGLESLRLGSVGGLIGASVNEFSTDGTLAQNSNNKVPTQNAVKTYVDGQIAGLNADKIIEGDTSVETIDSGSDGNIQFKIDAALKLQVNNDGHTIPGADSASDLGLTGTRWRNVYADTLYGDGSNITGITQTTINNNANNRLITGSGTANTLEGEASLTFDGTSLKNIGSGYRQLYLGSTNAGGVAIVLDGDSNGDGSGSDYATIHHDTTGNLHIRTDNPAHTCSMAFSTNGTVRTIIDANGDLRPNANNSYNLGTNSYRWSNIHTNDLNLSNEGGVNDVDGTWGSYTIQEGESDLFLINKRNGKKYKFNLTEVT